MKTDGKRWYGVIPSHDDFGKPVHHVFIDGRTVLGPWAIMTPETHAKLGCGLGVGRGQKYQHDMHTDRWYKIEG